jgi:hypothetical protein
VILLLKGPHSGRKWLGWSGNYSLRRPPPSPSAAAKIEADKAGEVDVEAQKAEGFMREKEQEETIVGSSVLESGQATPVDTEEEREKEMGRLDV